MPASAGLPVTEVYVSLADARAMAARHAGTDGRCLTCSPLGRVPTPCWYARYAQRRRRELADPQLSVEARDPGGGATPPEDTTGRG